MFDQPHQTCFRVILRPGTGHRWGWWENLPEPRCYVEAVPALYAKVVMRAYANKCQFGGSWGKGQMWIDFDDAGDAAVFRLTYGL